MAAAAPSLPDTLGECDCLVDAAPCCRQCAVDVSAGLVYAAGLCWPRRYIGGASEPVESVCGDVDFAGGPVLVP